MGKSHFLFKCEYFLFCVYKYMCMVMYAYTVRTNVCVIHTWFSLYQWMAVTIYLYFYVFSLRTVGTIELKPMD